MCDAGVTSSGKTAFCWESMDCGRDCIVRERRAVFCWRAYEMDPGRPRNCTACEYRRKWVRGEYTMEEFVSRYDRRSARRSVKRVLLVEDEPNILFALEETVRLMGYESISACDGEEGLVLAFGTDPDLIITDVRMPRVDGFTLCARLKCQKETRNVPIIIVTARDSKKDRERVKEIDCEAFIVKPFRLRELSEHIRRVLGPAEAGSGSLPAGGLNVCSPYAPPRGRSGPVAS